MHELTAEERRAFEDDGYFIRPTLFSAAEVDVLIGRIEDIVSLIETADALTPAQKDMILKRVHGAEASSGSAALNSLTRCHRFSAAVRVHIRDSRRLVVATALVGPDLFCPNDLFFLKPPGMGKPVAWHQDSWYFTYSYITADGEPLPAASIGTWLALDDADVEDGCLWVIPGSHRLGVVDHSEVEENGDYFLPKRVAVTPAVERRGISVEVAKGALIVFNNALLHSSMPNTSSRFRRAYVVHYMKSMIRPTARYTERLQSAADRSWGTWDAYI